MPTARKYALFTALALAATPSAAIAQLPLPELGEAPDLRIASADAFFDRLQSATQRFQQAANARQTAVAATRSRVERRLNLARSGNLVQRIDALAGQRLLEALQRELELRDAALDVVLRAGKLATERLPPPTSPPSLDDVVVAADRVERYEQTLRRQRSLARDLRRLGDSPGAPLPQDAALEQQALRQQIYLQDAEADLSEAQALEAEALARLGRRQLDAMQAAWRPSEEEIAEAEEALEEAETSADRERTRLDARRARTATTTRRRRSESLEAHEARQDEVDARVASLGYQRKRIGAQVIRAQARLATIRARQGRVELPEAQLTSSALTVRVAGAEQAVGRVETKLDGLPTRPKSRRLERTIGRTREALEKSLVALRATHRDLRRALLYAEIREGRSQSAPETTRSREVGFILSILVVLGAVFLLVRGYKWGQRLLRYQHLLPPALRMSERQLARLGTVSVLLWPVLVAVAAGALLIWPVWGLPLTVGEAIRLVDRPLFFVDQTGVSVLSLVKLAFAVYAASVLSSALREFLQARIYPQTDWDIGLTTALDTLVHYLTMTIGLVVGLRFVGVGFSALAILAGLLGIGIGFGLRNITENFISGLIILAERPIKIGDFIEIGGDELEGQVRRIRARSTTVVTRDNISIIIPNSEFVAGRVTNLSHGDPKVRLAIAVGVVYGSDVDLVRKVLLEVAERHGQVLNKPKPEVEFMAFGGSSLDFVLRAWIDQQVDRFRIASDLRFAVDAAFRKANIEIAFPQLDLHLKSANRALVEAALSRPAAPTKDDATEP